MFDFYYNKMTVGTDCEFDLAMTDTDSFLFGVTKPEKFWKHVEPFMDYSNYKKTHPKFSEKNKAKLGYFKDELGGEKTCVGYVGLRAKCYSLLLSDKTTSASSEKKICKGLGRVAISNRLRYDQYLECLNSQKVVRHKFNSIRSRKHNIDTVEVSKKALSYFDSKRFLLNCGIHSYPYGSVLIKKFFDKCQICK